MRRNLTRPTAHGECLLRSQHRGYISHIRGSNCNSHAATVAGGALQVIAAKDFKQVVAEPFLTLGDFRHTKLLTSIGGGGRIRGQWIGSPCARAAFLSWRFSVNRKSLFINRRQSTPAEAGEVHLMLCRTLLWRWPLAMFLIAFVGSEVQAATVSYAGVATSGEVKDWRTSATPKTFDVDGSNVYGDSLGAVHWTIAGANQKTLGSSTLGWGFVSSGTQYISTTYTDIDHITSAPVDADAGIALGAFTFELTGVAADYLGKFVRVGVMADVLGPTEYALDTFKAFRVQQTVGGLGDSGIVPLRGGAAGDGDPEMYFFDIYGATAGNRFQILALNHVGGTSGNSGYLGPVSFDMANVPEPASVTLWSILGLCVVVWQARQHRFRRA